MAFPLEWSCAEPFAAHILHFMEFSPPIVTPWCLASIL